jgi:hypothetical protein
MSSTQSHSRKPWYKIVCTLLALLMVMTPLITIMAEHHASEHISAGDQHFNTHSNHDTPVNADQSEGTAESALHFLAHIMHCCGHSVALLSDIGQLVLMQRQSVAQIMHKHSRIVFLSRCHFRPPIFL